LFDNPDPVLIKIDEMIKQKLLDIYSFQPGLCDHPNKLTPYEHKALNNIPSLLREHKDLFSSIQVASQTGGINFEAIRLCAELIHNIATPDPFLNIKFAVTCAVPPNTPFFPSAYHYSAKPVLTVALEAADEIVSILDRYPPNLHSLEEIRNVIQDRFRNIYDQLRRVLHPICQEAGIQFGGIDFSPAQYPTPEKSIGTAIERLKLGRFGEIGTLFAVGFLTQCIQNVDRPHIGFSGFMQPLLEDFIIGARHSEGTFDISKLMLYSTVCGLGLDCIPLPGDADIETLTLLLMDLAMLSTRLKKPLTARLMPIPGKKAGDMTTFSFEYFTNSKICQFNSSHPQDLAAWFQHNPSFLL
jgi:uncharacterized protein (UPF0210 family)